MNPNWDPAALQRLLLANTISPPRCAVSSCCSTKGLLRCSACKVVSYCGTAHQAAHRRQHKHDCTKIRKTRADMERREAELRAMPPDFGLPEDVFNSGVGHFWGILDTRDYMRARFAAMDALLRIDTVDAVQQALSHCMEMLRLCRSDNLGVRKIVPALMFRLGKEQECYDFIKWWSVVDYDWDEYSQPYLETQGADPLEPLDTLLQAGMCLAHASTLALLKIRMRLDLTAYENDDGFPPDPSLDRKIGQVISSRVSRDDHGRIASLASDLEQQFETLCRTVHEINPHFWELLINDSDIEPPEFYSVGSPEEAALACIQCKRAWEESEDAMLMIESKAARYAPFYQPKPVPWRQPTSHAEARNREKRHAAGTAFPSLFRFPLATPDQLFNNTPVGPYEVQRFVSRCDSSQALVFVDGACANNGQAGSRGGWAVVRGSPVCSLGLSGDGPSIISGKLEDEGPFGGRAPATSNRAELRAAASALRDCDWLGEGFRSLVIATDSSYVVDGATRWSKTWLSNGWNLRTGETVKNQDLWDLLLGDVERLKDAGLNIEFWKIPRELNHAADAAAKAASAKPETVRQFQDMTTCMAAESPGVLALVLECSQLFNDIHAQLVGNIAAKTTFERVVNVDSALECLSYAPLSTVILVADSGLTRYQALREAVLDRLHAGATVILAGQFSNMVSEGQFNRLMRYVGLPWKRGSYERSNLKMRPNAIGDPHLCRKLPQTYSAKALCIRNVSALSTWYAHEYDSEQAAVALAKVGRGRLGYLGDVNGELFSNQVVLAMCGLL